MGFLAKALDVVLDTVEGQLTAEEFEHLAFEIRGNIGLEVK